MPDPYSVVEYRIENLRRILGDSPDIDASALEDKLHLLRLLATRLAADTWGVTL
jgi:hypothetical protein